MSSKNDRLRWRSVRAPGPRIERCECGAVPQFHTWRGGDDVMISCFGCPCGVRGPETEDAYADRGTARLLWDRMRKREIRIMNNDGGKQC